jgi:hypothetical protein
VTVLATTADGGDRLSVGIDLLVEKVDGAMVGLFVVGLEEPELGMGELAGARRVRSWSKMSP